MMAPTMTKAEFRSAHRSREMDRPPSSVNFSMSGSSVKDVIITQKNLTKTSRTYILKGQDDERPDFAA